MDMFPPSLHLLFQSFLSLSSGFLTVLKILYLSQNPKRCIQKMCWHNTVHWTPFITNMHKRFTLVFLSGHCVLRAQVHTNAHAFRKKITERRPSWGRDCETAAVNGRKSMKHFFCPAVKRRCQAAETWRCMEGGRSRMHREGVCICGP